MQTPPHPLQDAPVSNWSFPKPAFVSSFPHLNHSSSPAFYLESDSPVSSFYFLSALTTMVQVLSLSPGALPQPPNLSPFLQSHDPQIFPLHIHQG